MTKAIIGEPLTVEARLEVLENHAIRGAARDLVALHGENVLAEIDKMREQVWDLFSRGLDLNRLPPDQAKALEAEIRSAWDRHLMAVRAVVADALAKLYALLSLPYPRG